MCLTLLVIFCKAKCTGYRWYRKWSIRGWGNINNLYCAIEIILEGSGKRKPYFRTTAWYSANTWRNNSFFLGVKRLQTLKFEFIYDSFCIRLWRDRFEFYFLSANISNAPQFSYMHTFPNDISGQIRILDWGWVCEGTKDYIRCRLHCCGHSQWPKQNDSHSKANRYSQ